MPHIFELPIDQIAGEDIDALIEDGVAEGRHLEFKSAVPVSPEEARRARADGGGPRPAARGLTNYGRDALLEELVAFANADGGLIVVGVQETEDAPPRAAASSPLPEVASLERRLRDAAIDCVEPRLPNASIRALCREDGTGYILMHSQASSRRPHWVRTSRRATIRREDRCDPLSMTEIQEMTLAQAGREDTVRAAAAAAGARFVSRVQTTLSGWCPQHFVGGTEAQRVEAWLKQSSMAYVAIRATSLPHRRLQAPRFERLVDLPPMTRPARLDGGGTPLALSLEPFALPAGSDAPALDAVEASWASAGLVRTCRIQRDGMVESLLIAVDQRKDLGVPFDWLAGVAGATLAAYDSLRRYAGDPATAAELSVEIRCSPGLRPLEAGGSAARAAGGPLPTHSLFPLYGIGHPADFSARLNELARDLANAAGLAAAATPVYALVAPDA